MSFLVEVVSWHSFFHHDGPPERPKSWWPAIWKSAPHHNIGETDWHLVSLYQQRCYCFKLLMRHCTQPHPSFNRSGDHGGEIMMTLPFAPSHCTTDGPPHFTWSKGSWKAHFQIQRKLKTLSNKKWSMQTPQGTSWQWLVAAKSNAVWPPQMLPRPPRFQALQVCLWHANPAIRWLWNFASSRWKQHLHMFCCSICEWKSAFSKVQGRNGSKFGWREANVNIKTHSTF